MIKPIGADINRRVRLPRFGGAPLLGKLLEVRSPDGSSREFPYAMVIYDGERLPVPTDMAKLEWEAGEDRPRDGPPEPLNLPPEDETQPKLF